MKPKKNKIVMAGLPERSGGKPGHPFPRYESVFMGPRDPLHFVPRTRG
jgi:hypothetical protein